MKSDATPLVSILTPSFNQAAWLPDNLASVACQTYPMIEHIVMDGGSTDGSVDVLRAAGDSVSWVSEPDAGQSDAINKAFAASSGEIIGWINSDDAYFDCRVIADVVAFFEAHPDADVVYGHCAQIDADGRIIQLLWSPPYDETLLRAVNVLSQPAVFIRRGALTEPMLDATFHFAMDYELWLRLAREGRRFGRIDRIAAVDRHYPARKSSTITDVMDADLVRLAETHGALIGPEHERARSRFYVRQRLMGALLAPRVTRDVAFTAPADLARGLVRRQVFTRRSDWPEEYR